MNTSTPAVAAAVAALKSRYQIRDDPWKKVTHEFDFDI